MSDEVVSEGDGPTFFSIEEIIPQLRAGFFGIQMLYYLSPRQIPGRLLLVSPRVCQGGNYYCVGKTPLKPHSVLSVFLPVLFVRGRFGD